MKHPSSLILIVLAIALFFTFTKPQYKKAQEIKALSEQYTAILDNVENIQSERDRLLVNYQQIDKAEIERLFKALPENVDSVHLALDLDKMAAQYGLSIKKVTVDKLGAGADQVVFPNSSGPYERVRVSFSFVSNYINFQKLLADMEKSLRILDVKTLQFKVDDKGIYQHEVTVETYWHKK